MHKKYNINHYNCGLIDLDQNCKIPDAQICKVCHNYGHFVFHLNSKVQTETQIELRIGVNHAHFLTDKKTGQPKIDEGRNVTCYVDKMMVSKIDDCEVRFVFKHKRKKLPRFIKKRLQEDDVPK